MGLSPSKVYWIYEADIVRVEFVLRRMRLLITGAISTRILITDLRRKDCLSDAQLDTPP